MVPHKKKEKKKKEPQRATVPQLSLKLNIKTYVITEKTSGLAAEP
jgi:hypothetical protein